jgi:RNA polymerase sigma-70 factor (ECF subfamily)
MTAMAGTTTLSELASAIGIREQESAIIAELKAGSEAAYAWLIGEFHQPIYSLVYRIVNDPSDAADTTQDIFVKIFRGMKQFHGESSLKTWIYRIAVHEASNRRRWWFRHKSHETSIEPAESYSDEQIASGLIDVMADDHNSPFENYAHEEIRARVEHELRQIPEPFRTTVVLRDIEEMSYEDIAEIMRCSLGTVKSRVTRGRQALKQRLFVYVKQFSNELGLCAPEKPIAKRGTGAELRQGMKAAS